MRRGWSVLTLENPDHGILPDRDAIWPPQTQSPHANVAETLRAEGRRVIEIDCDTDETERRTATIAAMKAGADFIVDGQLSAGNFSDRVDLLMRTSGYSQLGDFLYIPMRDARCRDVQADLPSGIFR